MPHPKNIQFDHTEIPAENAKASLGIATHLMSQLMPQQAPEGQETQEMDQGEAQTMEPQKDPVTEIQDLKTEIISELQSIREDMKTMQPKDEKSEINDLKKQIEDVLNND